ncbi:CYTH domain-containing protein [Geminicoccus flavidas]|uniref:CYTH domain-containing protein n=1 Tax=Geminicoccus flavidas TaxID=2506407 RepID=UPI00135B4105|nr:CYTH domain-containing protein [Geminicoccus flavidas]
MGLEIERKFLVRSAGWREAVTGCRKLRDGLLARFGDGKVRIRIEADKAWMTVKGPRVGIVRAEFQYEIPYLEGEAMLTLCDGPILEKTRHLVPFEGFTWEVDVYENALQGLIIAEIELQHADQAFSLPSWVGREVTFDPRYKKANIFKLYARSARVLG